MSKVGRPPRKVPGFKRQFVLEQQSLNQIQRWAKEHDCSQSEALAQIVARATTKPSSPYIENLRRTSPQDRLLAALKLQSSARELKEAALRMRHPSWTCEKIRAEVAKAFLLSR